MSDKFEIHDDSDEDENKEENCRFYVPLRYTWDSYRVIWNEWILQMEIDTLISDVENGK